MKNNYIYIVSFMSVPDHYNVLATTDVKKAVTKKIESDCYDIEIWLEDTQIGTYGDLVMHNQTDSDTVMKGVKDIIEKYKSL